MSSAKPVLSRRDFLQVAPSMAALAGLCVPRLARASATLLREPYLQNVHADRASILWTTQEGGSGSATLTDAEGRTITAPASIVTFQPSDTGMSSPFYQYRVDFTGLEASSAYSYRVTVDRKDVAHDPSRFSFCTAPRGKFSFLVFGDSGVSSEPQQTLVQLMSQETAASMVVHIGDMAYPNGTFSEFESTYYATNAALMRRLPFFSVAGNHEYNTDFAAPYVAGVAAPESGVPAADLGRYYSFDRGHAHFVGLDSNLLPTSHAADMLAWLDTDLGNTSKPWRIVFVHHTPYPTGFHLGDPICALVRQLVNPIVERHGVQLVIAGHEHGYERSYPLANNQPVPPSAPSTLYLVTGGGGGALESSNTTAQCAFAVEAFNYLRVHVDRHELVVKSIGVDGSEIDRVVLPPSEQMSFNRAYSIGGSSPELAAGSLFSIAGTHLATHNAESLSYPLATRLGGVEVRVDGRPLPLLSVSAEQIRAQLPHDVSGTAALEIAGPQGSVSANIKVSSSAPSLISIFSRGASFSSLNPARPGGEIALYLTGLGQVEKNVEPGEAAPSTPVRVIAPVEIWLGDTRIQASFAGLQPGTAGLYRVDFTVPRHLPDGIYALRVVTERVSSRPVNLDVLSTGNGDRNDRARSKIRV